MARGPLPNPNRVRRNAPVIPTTKLPAGGRKGPAPEVPEWVLLSAAGRAWWAWAWALPQALGWSAGDLAVVARRASLEDDMAALDRVEGLDAWEALDALSDPNRKVFTELVGRLAGLASGRLSIVREMRELDAVLGLTPKAMAALRWTIVPDAEPQKAAVSSAVAGKVTSIDARRTRTSANAS